MRVFCDDIFIEPRALDTFEAINDVCRKKAKGNELLYVEGSRTSTTLLYQKAGGKLPFELTFTDRFNRHWKVVIDKNDDTVTMFIPCGTQMLWYGADESPTMTKTGVQIQWAQVQFNYEAHLTTGTHRTIIDTLIMSHAGVRITLNGYREKSTGQSVADPASLKRPTGLLFN